MKMKMFAFLTTLSLSLFGAPAMAAEDPVWGAWASTDDNALAQILAVNSQADPANVMQLGPEDSALLDVGSLLATLVGVVNDADPCGALAGVCGTLGIGNGTLSGPILGVLNGLNVLP